MIVLQYNGGPGRRDIQLAVLSMPRSNSTNAEWLVAVRPSSLGCDVLDVFEVFDGLLTSTGTTGTVLVQSTMTFRIGIDSR